MIISNKFSFILLLVMMGCQSPNSSFDNNTSSFSEDGVNMVVEIPAGTNHKVEYRIDAGKFENDIENGKERVVRFLPYPGNYGFIPSTLMDKERGGDGGPLDILVIGESQPTGTLQEVIPIAVLELMDNGEVDNKLIAIPADTALQVMPAQDFQSFLIEYDAAKRIIETWFLNYKGFGEMELVAWKDEKAAIEEIKKWSVN